MKVYPPFVNLPAKIGLILLCLVICSCNALKRVEEDEQLLTEYSIHADGEKITDPLVNSLVLQKPNSRLLGIPLRLHLYNLAKKDADSSYQAWLNRKDGRRERLESLLSKKQVKRLGESFFVSGYSDWLKRVGEAPAVIDTARINRSVQRLSSYYTNRGYFNNSGSYQLDSTGRQRAAVRYQLDLGEPYLVDSLSRRIASPAIDSIYALNRDASLVREGDVFDLGNFTQERERLTTLFRNSGVWNFQESSITYDILRDTLSRDDQQMHVELNIDNLRRRGDSAVTDEAYRVRRMGNIHIYPDHRFQDGTQKADTVRYDNYIIHFDGRLRYKPKVLADAIFLDQDSVYRDIDRLRTYRQISNLNTFRYPNIELIEAPGDRLDANVYLSARPRNSLAVDFDVTHSNIQRLGFGLGASLITRNVFGGAETLSLSARGTFGLLSDDTQGEDFFSEIGGDINLIFPRIWFPLVDGGNIIPYYMLPKTRMTVGTSFQKNIGLDKQTLNAVLGYSWSSTDFKKHLIELLNIQFVRNVNPDRFFNVYQSSYGRLNDVASDPEYLNNPDLAGFYEPGDTPEDPPNLTIPEGTTGFTDAIINQGLAPTDSQDYADVFRVEERRQRLTENNLIFTSNYTYTKNSKTGINDNSFYQIRWKLEGAGNLLAVFTNIVPFNENDSGKKLVFGVPFSQYLKGEFDFIRHWELNATDVLAFRTFIGLAVPYGNSDDIPFVRSYFGGGSNDNRAWFPYSLGPGSTSNLNDFNDANFKLAMNLEYRFPLVGDLKAALFSDVGNIWNVWDSEDDPAATFNGFSSLEELALGTGFGLRYDFTYFVFRADLGFKTYNPAEPVGKRWFRDYNFANSVLQIGINYPF
ncbi:MULTISPECIES: BamA/TamA family outer membrane protein [unclassified Robiginitalea]|mgnify:CR=1 FL=1|uniref:translocation and assembly module lipoprotein TamL n=1 Tax=Robiginitalea TaxID=252306 RepID=UPI00234B4C55|nr:MULTISPECIES: BamA/TamA family outer membrane protein [unclassified Robiginitalea]MDC6354613.1 BamA/TamA family outer membrane protein [Robiginitalea sp. PM2]MDC6374705.1 BamA/TamA family outer membrane protein [Robiginitalea sp. SP8]